MQKEKSSATAAKEQQATEPGNRPYLIHMLILTLSLASAILILPGVEKRTISHDFAFEIPASIILPSEPVPDFSEITDTDERKAVFFGFLRPYVDQINAEMLAIRSELSALSGKRANGLSQSERQYIDALTERFEIQPQSEYSQNHFQQLLRRVDVLPVSLVLAQAANESAWGTSRFALQGNNFFGQWCYEKGCGIVPNRRRSGASHEVRAFDSVADSVRAYFMNLNTFPSYRKLRLIRQQLRQNGQSIDGIKLSEGLDSYSERGDAYIEELQSMIYYNDLHLLDDLPQA